MPRTVAPTSAWGRFTRRAGATRKRSGNIRPGSRPNRTNPKRWRHCGNCRASIRLKGRQYLEPGDGLGPGVLNRSEEHTSELQSLAYLVCRLLLEKKKKMKHTHQYH